MCVHIFFEKVCVCVCVCRLMAAVRGQGPGARPGRSRSLDGGRGGRFAGLGGALGRPLGPLDWGGAPGWGGGAAGAGARPGAVVGLRAVGAGHPGGARTGRGTAPMHSARAGGALGPGRAA